MSFGFSVGDVILLSQLSVQIYRTVTAGRKNASRDLQELADVLFGFQCALDHLSNVADELSKKPDPPGAGNASHKAMRLKLDQMVRNCASTLADLDSATKKYREGDLQESVEAGVEVQSASISTSASTVQRANLKQRLASNIMRIRWDIDKDTLKVYRDKLQAHADAINMVVHTFVWSTTQQIHTDTKITSQKLTALHDQVTASNQELTQLLQSVAFTASSGASSSSTGLSISPHIAESPSSKISLAGSTAIQSSPSISASLDLPAHIQALNAKRLSRAAPTGPKAAPNVKPLATAKAPTFTDPLPVQQLIKQLHQILPSATPAHRTAREAEITAWIQQLDRTLDSRIWGGVSKKDNQDLVDIVIHLNDVIEHADSSAREKFYIASRTVNVDFILNKISDATGSVRARQHIEEFAEERESWEEMYQQAGD